MKDLVTHHKNRDLEKRFDIRFVVSEQHYWEQFSVEDALQTEFTRNLGKRVLYDRGLDPFPYFFVIDMMLTWNCRFYESSLSRPADRIYDRAGMRISQSIDQVAARRKLKSDWIIWTTVPCEDIRRGEIAKKIKYKDSFEIYDVFKMAERLRPRRSFHC